MDKSLNVVTCLLNISNSLSDDERFFLSPLFSINLIASNLSVLFSTKETYGTKDNYEDKWR